MTDLAPPVSPDATTRTVLFNCARNPPPEVQFRRHLAIGMCMDAYGDNKEVCYVTKAHDPTRTGGALAVAPAVAEANIDLRMSAHQFELAKLQAMKNLIGVLPLPLP